MLKVLAWCVHFVTDDIAVLVEKRDGFVADFTAQLGQLWEAPEMNSTLSLVCIDESVEDEPKNLT